MKKLLSVFAAAAMLFGFASCSGDLHDAIKEDTSILGQAGIIGTINGWTAAKMTKVNDTTYTYDFTAADTSGQFSIQEVFGSWTTRWCGYLTKADNLADAATANVGDDFVAMVYSDDPDPSHVQLKGLEIASVYTITVRIDDPATKAISCKVSLKKAVVNTAGPLDNFVLKNDMNNFGDGLSLTANGDKTEYSVEFKAIGETLAFKLATEDWSVAYPCVSATDSSPQTIAADGTGVAFYKGDCGMSNPSLTGLSIGTTYVMTIVPDASGDFVTITVTAK